MNNYKIIFVESRNYGLTFEIKQDINYTAISKQDAQKRFNAVFGLWCNIVSIEKI